MNWEDYPTQVFFDELIAHGQPRETLGGFARFLRDLSVEALQERQRAAELAIRAMGITFTVYEDATNIDRAWPFDLLPRSSPPTSGTARPPGSSNGSSR